MTLEDFEKSLAQAQSEAKSKDARSHHRKHKRSRDSDRDGAQRNHPSSRHRSHHHDRDRDRVRHRDSSRHGHKRRRQRSRSRDRDDGEENRRPAPLSEDKDWEKDFLGSDADEGDSEEGGKEEFAAPPGEEGLDEMIREAEDKGLRRDEWMQGPGAEVEYVRRSRVERQEKGRYVRGEGVEMQMLEEEEREGENKEKAGEKEREISYTFGDKGSGWRMIKLKAVYGQAQESGQSVEEVAIKLFGDLRAFDDAREEEVELDRRRTYGKGYVRKDKPTGEVYQERLKKQAVLGGNVRRSPPAPKVAEKPVVVHETRPAKLDQTALNRMKAEMIKAKLRRAPNAAALEEEYNKAAAAAEAAGPIEQDIVLNPVESRMIAGGRKGEVKSIGTKRGRERGLVEENDDMSIEDMVRQERRTKLQSGLGLAERIAKDAKFENDLDYMDENASKLAKSVQHSETNLRNTAISDFHKFNRILDNCPLCHHEDKDLPPIAPVVSLATRVYLTLPTEPEISNGGAVIVPIQHHTNLLECDDDEWEEIRNFMKSLTRLYHDQGRDVLFYENATAPHRKPHAALNVVPIPYALGDTAPAFFREAMLAADEEWAQHRKVIDTAARARDGWGRSAFRRSLVKEMPYFHVWFNLDGGLGHIVEDEKRWPKGDMFAREVVGGMLDVGPDVVKKQGRWQRNDRRVEKFKKGWRKFDWSRVLVEGQ